MEIDTLRISAEKGMKLYRRNIWKAYKFHVKKINKLIKKSVCKTIKYREIDNTKVEHMVIVHYRGLGFKVKGD